MAKLRYATSCFNSAFLIFNIALYAEQNFYPISQVIHYADALNTEGGIIPQQKLHTKQLWANIGTVLDRPFVGIELEDLTQRNTYPLKEASLASYNEPFVHFVHISILKYYIDNGFKIMHKKDGDQFTIIVQIHRGRSGLNHLKLFATIFEDCYPSFLAYKQNTDGTLYKYTLPNRVTVVLRYGFQRESFNGYEDADVVFSISLVSGLKPGLQSGDLVLPTTFIPLNLATMVMHKNRQYSVKNHLIDILEDLIATQDSNALAVINSKYYSQNKSKADQRGRTFTKQDFQEVTLLQANSLFNPSLLPPSFSIHQN